MELAQPISRPSTPRAPQCTWSPRRGRSLTSHGAAAGGTQILMHAYGILALAPPHSWRKSHNFHHRNVGKVEGSEVGSLWIMTTDAWRKAPRTTRLHYRVFRSPLTLLFAYVAIFFWRSPWRRS